MSRRRITAALLLGLLAAPGAAGATGAWQNDVQYSFINPEGVAIVAPFVDAEGRPWVLGNHFENFTCHFLGPFGSSSQDEVIWQVEDETATAQPTQCLSLTPGPAGGFLVRGQILPPPPPAPEEPPRGFLVSFDAEWAVRWVVFDESYTERGVYGGPLPFVAWSEDIGRIVVFFNGLVRIGTQTGTQLHGLSIADETGLVRRTISTWGNFSSGQLRGLEVIPETGDFLVVGHASGTQFLLYNGLESVSTFTGGTEIDWSDEDVNAVRAIGDSVYISHFPRLDMQGIATNFGRFSADGATMWYDETAEKTIEVTDPNTGQPVDFEFTRPFLTYFTDNTATFVRSAPGDFVLHTYDAFTGDEWALQSLATVDENQPTHVGSAGDGDRLILMTAAEVDGALVRYINVMLWDGEAATPPGYPQPDGSGGGGGADAGGGGDAGAGGDAGGGGGGAGGGSEDGGGDDGGCQVAGRTGDAWALLAAIGIVAALPRRRARQSAR
jgi:hypothetical protein